ncbi:hypothetical protein L873DRAFT_1823606 [Choiromyces venosus 120613-1]|uniref:Uncharacterized protein n=1 Tax=Choiromyces venosus 120613-1 TaxID=1336337 RepID=A0A3N4IXX9_9PEZI|nr:hypothetical protein L873DRAFT_1823606 [Choiromyces venosus 120613-1]
MQEMILPEFFEKLWKSILVSVQAVIHVMGWYTCYYQFSILLLFNLIVHNFVCNAPMDLSDHQVMTMTSGGRVLCNK